MATLTGAMRVAAGLATPRLRYPTDGDATLTVSVTNVFQPIEIVLERSRDGVVWTVWHRIGPCDGAMGSTVRLRQGEYYRARVVGGEARLSIEASAGELA